MIEKIAMSMIFISLIIAVFLAINGVTEINLSSNFYSLMVTAADSSNLLNIQIPSIPMIPNFAEVGDFVNGLITFVNGIVTFLNVIVTILNVLIQLLMFIINIIINFNVFKDSLLTSSSLVAIGL